MYDNQPEYHNGVAIVKKNGKYGAIMVGGKEIIPPIYDGLSTFVDGLATAKYMGEERTINLSGQIQIKYGNKYVFLPEEYDWGYDFIGDICIVAKKKSYGFRYGLVSYKQDKTASSRMVFELLLPCEYSEICKFTNIDYEHLGGIFGDRPGDTPFGGTECKNLKGFVTGKYVQHEHSPCAAVLRYGLVNFNGNIIAETKYSRHITTIKDKYFQLEKDIEMGKKSFCIIDEKGNTLTPDNCEKIALATIDDVDYWIVQRNNLEGVYCNNNEFIPIYFKEIIPHSDSFDCIISPTNETVTYNSKGQVVLSYVGQHIVFPSDYSIILESSIIGLFRVRKDNKWGIVNSKKEWVVPNEYLFIEPFDVMDKF